MRILLDALSAVLPVSLATWRRSPAATPSAGGCVASVPATLPERVRAQAAPSEPVVSGSEPAASPRLAPTASLRPSAAPNDPSYLCVVPYVPAHNRVSHLKAHPRIVNPFRAFPRRGHDLLTLMHSSVDHER